MIETIIDNNVDRIKKDLVDRGLTYDTLIDDLLDHVCCMVEDEMVRGKDFDSSYNRVLNSIGDNRLVEIEHQTLLLLNKKFQLMKKFTYIIGLVSAIIVLLGSLWKRMHWPGAGIMLSLGLLIIILVFLPLYFIVTYREQTEKKSIIYPVMGYLTLALLLAGAVFKIQHWPGAGTIIEISLAVLVIGFVPLYVVNAFQKVKKGKISLPYIIMLMVGVAIISLTLGANMGKDQLETYRTAAIQNLGRIDDVEVRTAKLIDIPSDSVHKDRRETIMMIHSTAESLQNMIDEMLDEMLQVIKEPGVSVADLKRTDQKGVGRDVIVDNGWAKEFITAARDYYEMLVEVVDDPVTRSQIGDHLEFTGMVWYNEWGYREVIYDPVIKIYYKHTDVSKGIALSEYVAISTLLHD